MSISNNGIEFSAIDSTLYINGKIQNDAKNKKLNLIFLKQADGKTITMTREQYYEYLNKLQQRINQQTNNKDKYELGKIRHGNRVIDTDNVSAPLHAGSSRPTKGHIIEMLEYNRNIQIDNNNIDNFKQGKRGDCYFLASIDSIRRTKDGQAILDKNVQKNKNGSYTITLPGAIIAKNHYAEIGYGDKCAITGTYTITAAAVEKAKQMSGKSYAYGDINVILLELAMEAFRAEVQQTNKVLGQDSQRYIAGQFTAQSEYDPLSGGQSYDANFILTGQKSEFYQATNKKTQNLKPYRFGEYGFVNDKEHTKSMTLGKARGVSEISHLYNKDSDLQKLLSKYEGKEEDYAITVNVRVAQDGPDGSTKAGGGHALTVSKITEDYVEVVNPWDTSKKERIPRSDFEQMAYGLCVTPMSKKRVDYVYDKINEDKDNKFNLSIQQLIAQLMNKHKI